MHLQISFGFVHVGFGFHLVVSHSGLFGTSSDVLSLLSLDGLVGFAASFGFEVLVFAVDFGFDFLFDEAFGGVVEEMWFPIIMPVRLFSEV